MTKCKQKRIENEIKETLKSRERYRWYKAIQKRIKKGTTVKDACKAERIPRSEYYYWKRKVDKILSSMKPGALIRPEMFRALSSKPKTSPKQILKHIENLIVKIRKEKGTGAEDVQHTLLTHYLINLSVSCVQKVIKRNGLIKERKYHQKKKPKKINRNYQPGEKVQVDTKYVKTAKKTYYQYSAIDLGTGIIFKQLFQEIGPDSSSEFVRNLVRYMPFKIHNIQTDNGIEYTWRLHPEIQKEHPFTTQCRLLQITHLYIPPASPTFNSHVERTHRVDKEELWNKKRYISLKSMKKDLKKYVHFYNHSRATKSKNWLPPVDFAKKHFGLKFNNLCYCVQEVCN